MARKPDFYTHSIDVGISDPDSADNVLDAETPKSDSETNAGGDTNQAKTEKAPVSEPAKTTPEQPAVEQQPAEPAEVKPLTPPEPEILKLSPEQQAKELIERAYPEERRRAVIEKWVREKLEGDAGENFKKACIGNLVNKVLADPNLAEAERRSLIDYGDFSIRGTFGIRGLGKINKIDVAAFFGNGNSVKDIRNARYLSRGRIELPTGQIFTEGQLDDLMGVVIEEIARKEVTAEFERRMKSWVDDKALEIQHREAVAAEQEKAKKSAAPAQPEAPKPPEPEAKKPAEETGKKSPEYFKKETEKRWKKLSPKEQLQKMVDIKNVWSKASAVEKAIKEGQMDLTLLDTEKELKNDILKSIFQISGRDLRREAKAQNISAKKLNAYLVGEARKIFDSRWNGINFSKLSKGVKMKIPRKGNIDLVEASEELAPNPVDVLPSTVEMDGDEEQTPAISVIEAPASQGPGGEMSDDDLSALLDGPPAPKADIERKAKEAEKTDRTRLARTFKQLYDALDQNGEFYDEELSLQKPKELEALIEGFRKALTGKAEEDKKIIESSVALLPNVKVLREKVQELLEDEKGEDNLLSLADDDEPVVPDKAPAPTASDVPTVLRGSTPGPARPMMSGKRQETEAEPEDFSELMSKLPEGYYNGSIVARGLTKLPIGVSYRGQTGSEGDVGFKLFKIARPDPLAGNRMGELIAEERKRSTDPIGDEWKGENNAMIFIEPLTRREKTGEVKQVPVKRGFWKTTFGIDKGKTKEKAVEVMRPILMKEYGNQGYFDMMDDELYCLTIGYPLDTLKQNSKEDRRATGKMEVYLRKAFAEQIYQQIQDNPDNLIDFINSIDSMDQNRKERPLLEVSPLKLNKGNINLFSYRRGVEGPANLEETTKSQETII